MRIVFDLDNTLTDESGSYLRPGAQSLLDSLKEDGHTLILWTNSIRIRTKDILSGLDIAKYFTKVICREDYDPDSQDGWKDIRKVGGEVLIDDNPHQKEYGEKYGYKVYVVKPFTSSRPVKASDFTALSDKLKPAPQGFFRRLFSQ